MANHLKSFFVVFLRRATKGVMECLEFIMLSPGLLKDLVCRYKTIQGFQVKRKGMGYCMDYR